MPPLPFNGTRWIPRAHNTFAGGSTDAHWQRSAAVQNGEQPRADPDAADLIEFDEEVRRYRDGLCKRLVDGCWIAALEGDTAV